MNLKSLKCLIVDEADVFFETSKDIEKLTKLHTLC